MTIVSASGDAAVAVHVDAHDCLEHVSNLARMVRPGTAIAVYGDRVGDVERWYWCAPQRRRKWKVAA